MADISDRPSITSLVASLSKLDVLINCAGIVLPDTPCNQFTPLPELQAALLASPHETWSRTFSTNVESLFFLSASALHLLAAAPAGGRIINISSIGSTMSDPVISQPAYQASKAKARAGGGGGKGSNRMSETPTDTESEAEVCRFVSAIISRRH